MTREELQTLAEELAPLTALLGGRTLRVVARPGAISRQRAEGSEGVEVVWPAAAHGNACEILAASGPLRLPDGTAASVVGETLVLQGPADPLRRIDDLVAEGRMSALAGRLLNEALSLGRNVLLVGSWEGCCELATTLVAHGDRPVLIGDRGCAAPPAWPVVRDVEEARRCGADRLGVWSGDAEPVVDAMRRGAGVVGWLDARRIDRALMRFEWAAQGAGPLGVLAGLDLVVVMLARPQPRVIEVAEICLAEEGYRPTTLFACGRPPAPAALVPVLAPSFLGELRRGGDALLADELDAACGGTVAPMAVAAVAAAPAPPAVTPPSAQSPLRRPVAAARGRQTAAPVAPALSDAPPPGWELDQLGDDALAAEVATISDPDAAAMAATYGLAPPPRPPGAALAQGGVSDGTFSAALQRARERDAQLQAELADHPGWDDDGGRHADEE